MSAPAPNAFVPETEGSFLHGKGASAYGLDAHMFYGQAGMFVGYMRSLNERAFQSCLHAVEAGDALGPAFEAAYRISIDVAWRHFVDDVRARNATGSPR
jgi:hypothetical protein